MEIDDFINNDNNNKNNEIRKRFYKRMSESYKKFFNGNADKKDVDFVLNDLYYYCKVYNTFDQNDRLHALNEGRRQVYERILNCVKLNEDELDSIYSKGELLEDHYKKIFLGEYK